MSEYRVSLHKENPIIAALMERDGLTREQASEQLEDARAQVSFELDNAEDVLREELGLEPDYLFDFIPF